MPEVQSSDVKLEIGHVLFIDIVGYSKLLITDQSQQLQRLKEIVRGTEQSRLAEAEGKLLRLPTGDGGALVFRNNPEAPVLCAMEISKELKKHPELKVRMGIHSGPVNEITDLNEQANIAGAGINIAERVMDCGDAGHILLSQHVADDLEQYPRWRPYLHDLGTLEVKHGARVNVANLYSDEFGNPRLPAKFQAIKKRAAQVRWAAVAIGLLLLGAIVGGAFFFSRRPIGSASAIVDKSIAVLPFENLSRDPDNAFFTDGVQDEILTDLAKIADLKVISRTSVMPYKSGIARNLRKIGEELGVVHVVEGSVQRAGNKVRVNAQLIDARTDTHLWAQSYDRSLADVFAIESEVAEKIVAELKANLSETEKAAIDLRPTRDLEAFDLYLQAKQLINTFHETPDWKESLLKALRLLDEAISRDANFTLAYCWAAQANDSLYWFGFDRTPGRLAQARAMAQKALTLAPDSGEAHLAQALVYYHGDRDFPRAREELAIACQALPNNAQVYSFTAYIDRREGQWENAVKNQEKAAELDPRNSTILGELALMYDLLRRYEDEKAVFDRAVAANPDSATYFQMMRAEVELEKGNTKKARSLLDSLPAGYDPDGAATTTRISLALYERDPASAAKILAASKLEELVGSTGSLLPRSWFEALIARAQGDEQKAREAFTMARLKIEAQLQYQPEDGFLLALLGQIDAGLSRKEQAIAEGRRATGLRPTNTDALEGARIATSLAMISAWVGEVNSAIEQLTYLAKTPGGPDYGQLKFDPAWDLLRGDPRFEKIVASLAPKEERKQ